MMGTQFKSRFPLHTVLLVCLAIAPARAVFGQDRDRSLPTLPTEARASSAEPAAASGTVDVGTITDIVVILDATTSMRSPTGTAGASRFDLARRVTGHVLDVAPTGIGFGVQILRDDVSELRPLQPLKPSDRTQIRDAVQAVNPFGEGNLVQCFQRVVDRLDAESSPLIVMVTDGVDYNPDAANLAASQMSEAFEGKSHFVLVGICKQGQIADRLQTLASFAGGDSLSLTSKSGVQAGLVSVREACEDVRRSHSTRDELLQKDRDNLAKQLQAATGRADQCANEKAALTAQVEELQTETTELKADIVAKNEETQRQAGQIEELTQRVDTAETALTETQTQLGSVQAEHAAARKTLTQAESDLKEAQTAVSKADKDITQLNHDLEVQQMTAAQHWEELKVFKESWIAPFAAWDMSAVLGAVVLLLGGQAGGSAVIMKLLKAQLGILPDTDNKVTQLGEAAAGLDKKIDIEQKCLDDLKDAQLTTSHQLEQMTEQAGRHFEKVVEQFERVTEQTALQFERTGQQFARLQEDTGRQFTDVTESTTRQVDDLTREITGGITILNGRIERTEEKLTAGQQDLMDRTQAARTDRVNHATDLKAAIQSEYEKANDQFGRLYIEVGRQATIRESLRQDIERATEETIRRNGEVIASHVAPAGELIREFRADVVRQTQLVQTWADGMRESVDRVSHQLDQVPTRIESTEREISAAVSQEMRQQLTNVQIAMQSIRDQIDNARHEFESGLHKAELLQTELVGRSDQINAEVSRVAPVRDEIVQILQAEFARFSSELNTKTHAVSAPLSRIESQLQSVILDFEIARRTGFDDTTVTERLQSQFDGLRQAFDEMKPADQPKPPVPQVTQLADEPTEEETAEIEERRRQRNTWIRELSLLRGLGRKSAETLVDQGVNSIHELATLESDRKAVLREQGGRLREIDDWVSLAERVSVILDHVSVELEEAVRFANTDSWPEAIRSLPPEQLTQLIARYPDIEPPPSQQDN